ncbi:MAG: arginine N-succinyltransferase [Myxococcota bacterium]
MTGPQPRYEIRAATSADQTEVLALAEHLNSVNLPHDGAAIGEVLEASDNGFSGNQGDPRKRQYVFVLRDLERDVAVGTSMIIGQKGNRDAAYIYLNVNTEEKYSPTLDKYFAHQVLSMGYSYNGPTEIGGLVIHPDYRRVPEKLGMMISYVRFLWIASHRENFQNYILAELMPPLEDDGTSHLWEAVGRRFTGMSYREADRLSKYNKAFIRSLFPDGDIYATLLSGAAQAVIGEVGRETRGVEKLLRRIGFRYIDRVDPFDGGPHFAGETDEITLVRQTEERRVRTFSGEGRRALVGRHYDRAPWFRCIAAEVGLDRQGEVGLDEAVRAHLDLAVDDRVSVLPLTRARPAE